MLKKTIKKYAVIVSGVILVALAISVFYTPNRIVNGGVSGIATILFHTFGIQPGVSYFIINITLLIVAWKRLGFTFVKDTIVGVAILSAFVQLFTYIPPKDIRVPLSRTGAIS